MPEPNHSPPKRDALVQALQWSHLGFVLPAAVLVGLGLGYLIDMGLGTTWVRYLGLVIGIVAGFIELIRAAIAMGKQA